MHKTPTSQAWSREGVRRSQTRQDSFDQRMSKPHLAPPLPTLTWEVWEQGLVRPSDALQGSQAHLGPLHSRWCQQQGTAQQHCGQHGLAQQEDPPLSPSLSSMYPQVPYPRKRPPENRSFCPLRTYLYLLGPGWESS